MFKTKNLVHDIKNIPVPWIFKHFCNINEKLTGQDIKIKSLFNPKERTPSMCIYTDKSNTYRYKDFSTGKGGSAIDLVKEITQLSFHKACQLIIETYNDFVLHNNGGYDLEDFQRASKYKVTSHKFRSWTTQDQYFWTQFNIGSRLLDEFHVKPLESYCMTKDDRNLCIKGLYLYGYFKADGTLYKIYQPKTLDKKFIKVADYIQGMHQCIGEKHLLITSSLKDVMSIKSLRLSIDIIAPDSENTMIKQDIMEELRSKYNKIIVMFDYDEAGIKAMQVYKEKYPFVEITVLPMSKDISDSIKDFGAKEVRDRLVPILAKKLNDGKEDSGKIKNTKNKECRDNDGVSLLGLY
jgi:hypothetical protein